MKRNLIILICLLLASLSPIMAGDDTSATLTLRFTAPSTSSDSVLIGFTSKDISTMKDSLMSRGGNIKDGLKAAFADLTAFSLTEETTKDDVKGYFSYYSTTPSAYTINVSAQPLASAENAKANSYTINYVLTIGDKTYDTASTTSTPISFTITAGGSEANPKYGSYAVSFGPDAEALANAPKDDYTGKISVSLSLN
ncbi:MAG: hypothetical protein LKE39_00530 [Sphaerochaeta sp.]|jgi:hypothetical protein|nr:hypothetical protein [Sphaerochaeta sp.]MCH3918982.1 hypothetical protein [Sphaerochaeta sp.]MCI2045365.1 hypothetical protein [Sphaerochaeta sp.]MCI2097115.1 hypothetical protein [Sphaerochaeta sp.]MCI2103495.1 hypothetical protein [Sphaerochaeta sp.]